MEAKKLNSLIAKIGKASGNLRNDIQNALIGCAEQSILHRNTTPFNQLLNAVGDGTRKQGMLRWMSLNAPVTFKDDAVVLSDHKHKNLVIDDKLFADLAASPNWWELTAKEKVENPWDGPSFLRDIAKYLARAEEKAKAAGDEGVVEVLQLIEVKLHSVANMEYEVQETEETIA